MSTRGKQIHYLLDTNILSALIRDPGGRVRDHIARVGENRVGTSIIVACELRFGAAKRGSRQLSQRVEAILSALHILAFDAPCDRVYAKLRSTLETSGQIIGPNDLLIAAQAMTHKLCLVTGNTREFSRVSGLKVENWL